MSMFGGSFISDQTTLHITGASTGVNMATGRTRVTYIQAAGASASEVSLYDQTSGTADAANLKAKFLFDVDGLQVFVPGSGILFKDGVTIVVVASAGATLTVTR